MIILILLKCEPKRLDGRQALNHCGRRVAVGAKWIERVLPRLMQVNLLRLRRVIDGCHFDSLRNNMLKRFWPIALAILLLGGASAAQTDTQPEAKPQAAGAHHPQYLSNVGKRKPPGAALDEREGTTPQLDRQERDIDDHVLKSICKNAPGCEGGHLWRRR